MPDVAAFGDLWIRLVLLAGSGFAGSALLRRLGSPGAHRIWVLVIVATLLVPITGVAGWRLPVVTPLPELAAVSGAPAEAPNTADALPPVRYTQRDATRAGLLTAAYVAGVGLVLLALLMSYARVRRVVRGSRAHPTLGNRRTSFGRSVRVHLSDACDVPVTVGVVRPLIVLPRESLHWQAPEVDAAIAHEEVHVRNLDWLWLLLVRLECALFWFHPAVWLIAGAFRRSADEASDAAAAVHVGGRRRYASLLVAIAAHCLDRPRPGMAVAMIGRRSALALRVDRLLAPPRRPRPVPFVLAGAAALCFASGFVAVSRAAEPLAATPLGARLIRDASSADAQIRANALFDLARLQTHSDEVTALLIAHLADAAPVPETPRWDFATEGWAPAHDSWLQPSPGEVAALGLASLGRAAAPALEDALFSPDPIVRRHAAWGLAEQRHPRSVSRRAQRQLVALLGDHDASVRAASAWAIGDLAFRRYDAEAALAAAANDADAHVRQYARASLLAVRRGISLEAFRHDG